jgi:gluconate 2-dehydrogenase subunit 3-like protein
MAEVQRRALVQGAVLAALSFTIGGKELWLSPREAKALGAPASVLKPDEVETLEAIGETLLPGARQAGIANFVDNQLAVPPGDCLLMARIANVRPPFANFYRAALGAIERSCQALHNKRFAQLAPAEQYDFADRLRQNKIEGWQGPPPPFIYFLLRHDAVDVAFGTVEGIEGLGIPYMPHIAPEKRW